MIEDEDDADYGDTAVPELSTPLEKSIARAEEIGAMTLDPAYAPSNARLRGLGITSDLHPDIGSDRLISMGTVSLAVGGGSLRTYSGGLNHECGWYPSYKARRLQHWEGITAFDHLIWAECHTPVIRMQSEGIRFRLRVNGKRFRYTADVDMWIGGRRHVVEVKRSERDLRDPDYRLKLAAVAEVCRRCGWIFRIVIADDIFANRHHRENCERFAMRRFARVDRRHIERLENFAMRYGARTRFWDIAEALSPKCIDAGEAVLQALVLRGRVEVNLARRIHPHTPVRVL